MKMKHLTDDKCPSCGGETVEQRISKFNGDENRRYDCDLSLYYGCLDVRRIEFTPCSKAAETKHVISQRRKANEALLAAVEALNVDDKFKAMMKVAILGKRWDWERG